MRQLQLSGSKKLRGVPRRLRALSKWSAQFEGCYYPRSAAGEKYTHCKIPVLSSLVNPPHTTKEIQTQCMNYLLQVADCLARSRPENATDYYRVACLFTLPYLFSSEVTVFYDPDYYWSFFGDTHELAPRKLSTGFGILVPDGFVERGCLIKDAEDGTSEEWWCVGQPL
jgi:Protein of unknown function (DUF3916)